MTDLREHQRDALDRMDEGKILWGGVGSGKTVVAMAYYVKEQSPKPLYVITTARKRNDGDWLQEAASFGIGQKESTHGIITVDSWNNIGKYTDVEDAFFIFDEQRLVGTGAWVKAFMKIAKRNNWIMLSATPGDTWSDYAPVFIANGFFKHRSDFRMKHVLYEPFMKYPKIKGYLNERKLELMRNEILVEMPYARHTERHLNWMDVDHDKKLLERVYKDRWHVYEDRPLNDAAEMFRVMRKVVNSDGSRLDFVRGLVDSYHNRLIVFYNFDYELDILRSLSDEYSVFEYNGHRKDPVPEGEKWVYLVQYIAGAEAWNCISTNAMCFYSLTYSYKNFEQSQGRIDRLNTPFSDLFYYILVSNSVPDIAIKKSLANKKSFNEIEFLSEAFDLDGFGDELYGVLD